MAGGAGDGQGTGASGCCRRTGARAAFDRAIVPDEAAADGRHRAWINLMYYSELTAAG